ncbi:MAG: hypothetical protein RLZZ528_2595 [Pseudomonadota bacterium]|jgi:outer membrane protein OmpA-like peptidoglycan-associated protein
MTLKLSATFALAGIAALSACTQTGMSEPSNARTGAIAGGLIGAAIGSQRDDDRLATAVVGGVIGAAIGGAIGESLDRQAAELDQAIQDDRVRIVNTGDRLIVTLPEGILFATDSAAVSPSIQSDLFAVASNLNRYPNSRVQVIGHTDNTGTAAYNQDLSERRATSVAAILQSGGVNPARLRAIGKGEDQPIASNLTPEGRQQNRRVEIIIIPNKG